MFERFTERARYVVVLAQDEARALRHNYIGTEHLLLGLLREDENLAARVLGSLGVTDRDVRLRVAGIVGHGDEYPTGQMPFTPRSKKVLELALREAIDVGEHFIGPEHILLGLVRENEGVATRVLLELDVDAETIRGAVIAGLEQRPRPAPVAQLERGWRSDPSPPRRFSYVATSHRRTPERLLIAGWLLFGVAAALGVLVGWLIWG